MNAVKLLSPQQYWRQFANPRHAHLLLDVRLPEEFKNEHIAGAVNIPVQVLADCLGQIPQDRPVIFYCRSGNRTKQAGEILSRAGYRDLYDLGGINQWKEQGLPVQ